MGRLVGTATEGFVDDHEAERARADASPFEAKLIGEAGGEDGVGEFLLLAAGFAAGIGVMLMLGVVFFPALAGGKGEPVAHVGDLAGPAPVEFGGALAAAEALDDGFDLKEFGLGVLVVFGPG